MRLLLAPAVAAEREAALAGLAGLADTAASAEVHVVAVGVGPAAAAAGTAYEIARARHAGEAYDAVASVGVAGGLPGRADVGDIVLASRSVAADLGANSPDGFLSIDELGFGAATLPADGFLKRPGAVLGDILSVSGVTGTADAAAELARRHPNAVAEAMEGFGVATAAARAGLPFAELRAISNLVGPRDKSAWRLAEALSALADAVATTMKEWA